MVVPAPGRVGVATPGSEIGHRQSCGEYVALDFDQRNRSAGNAAIGVEYRVDAVLPPLIGKSRRTGALVVEQAITVGIPVAVYPCHRRVQRRPQIIYKGHVGCPFRIRAGKRDK